MDTSPGTPSLHPPSREGHSSTRGGSCYRSFRPQPAGILHGAAGLLSRPAELTAIRPYSMHDDSQPTGESDSCFLPPPTPGDIHRPGLQPGPLLHDCQQNLRRFIKQRSHHGIAAQRDAAYSTVLTGLMQAWVSPREGPTAFELRKRAGTSIVAAKARATTGPTPGIVISLLQTASFFAMDSSRS
ncbi:hypothetical protein JOH51_001639 [Rhizobium leguminosarum]|nr:hypothetical protein [Rhizobium leguminosarum]